MRISNKLYQNLVFNEKEIQGLVQQEAEKFDYQAIVDLIETMRNKIPGSEEEKQKFPGKYSIPWLCREMYLAGFLAGLERQNEKI